jgi:hypothetical protein
MNPSEIENYAAFHLVSLKIYKGENLGKKI